MKLTTLIRSFGCACAAAGVLVAASVQADDIDIFLTPPSGGGNKPAVLFVLDNTANWSRQSQQWPDQDAQGQSEVRAIKQAIESLDDSFSVGLMKFVTRGNANQDGGYVRSDIRPMTEENKARISEQLDVIFDNINDPAEKRNANVPFGNLLHDVHNYLAGSNALFPGAEPDGLADAEGYTNPFTRFESPLSDEQPCSEVVIVFIGNPNSNGPAVDTAANTAALEALGGDTTQMLYPVFTTTTTQERQTLVAQTACMRPTNCPSTLDSSILQQCGLETSEAGPAFDLCECTQVSTAGCTTNGPQANRTARFQVDGILETTTVTQEDGAVAPFRNPINADEWSRFLYSRGVEQPTGDRRFARTYTIDVFNKQQNADHTALLQNMARAGGGRYFEARSETAIVDAILDIFSDIQSVNSTFASAALPISAANRTQNDNQVYIAMFRPDPDAKPRWFGNLKQYQIVLDGSGAVALGDADGQPAVNPLTGFVGECARSFWTLDTGDYFLNTKINPSPAGLCLNTENSAFSDNPDGPRVEKGGVSLVLRRGNNPPATDTTPDYLLRREVMTATASSLVDFDTTSSSLTQNTVDFTRGLDTEGEYFFPPLSAEAPAAVEVRPSVHGDVIHSRPQPVNYGQGTGTVVYYGSNDGHLRAVNGGTGKELWSFIAPEFFSRLERLRTNSPGVLFPDGVPDDDGVPRRRKDYFFDGSIGLYQTTPDAEGGQTVHVYPSMRRGGRMVYGLDVSDPNNPRYLWKVGCPNLDNDTNCTAGMSGIGQTWGTPTVGMIEGYDDGNTPVVIVVGGHDGCEDADNRSPSCGSAKGRVVYALDGVTGERLATFSPPDGVSMRSVVADPALVDYDLDGKVDHAYIADMGGKVYRIDFADPLTAGVRSNDEWTMSLIAYTSGSFRKFQFAPSLVLTSGGVYVALGSGDREHPLIDQYPFTNPIVNRFYVFVDRFSEGVDEDGGGDGDAEGCNAAAVPLDLDATGCMNNVTTNGPSPSDCSAEAILPKGAKRGWFFDLTDNGRGEQTVTSAAVAGGLLAFSTNRPTPQAEDSCGNNLGEARGYLVNVLTGSGVIGTTSEDCGGDRSVVFAGGGLPPSPVVARVTIGSSAGDGDDESKTYTVMIGAAPRDGSNASPIEVTDVDPTISSVRKPSYWFRRDTPTP